jgi:uncharacterized protein YodC (DUF2158 family)
MSDQFKAGDVVKLKSGGPDMTITRVESEGGSRVFVYCTWFTGNKNEKGHFPPEALKLAAIS